MNDFFDILFNVLDAQEKETRRKEAINRIFPHTDNHNYDNDEDSDSQKDEEDKQYDYLKETDTTLRSEYDLDRLVLAKVLREEKKSSCGWKRQPDSYSELQAAWNKLKKREFADKKRAEITKKLVQKIVIDIINEKKIDKFGLEFYNNNKYEIDALLVEYKEKKLKELEEEHKASQKKKQNEKLNLEKMEMIKNLIDDINQLENEISQERLNLRLLQLLHTRTDDLMKFDFSDSEKEKINTCSKSYIICSKMMKQSPDWSKNELLNSHDEIIHKNFLDILNKPLIQKEQKTKNETLSSKTTLNEKKQKSTKSNVKKSAEIRENISQYDETINKSSVQKNQTIKNETKLSEKTLHEKKQTINHQTEKKISNKSKPKVESRTVQSDTKNELQLNKPNRRKMQDNNNSSKNEYSKKKIKKQTSNKKIVQKENHGRDWSIFWFYVSISVIPVAFALIISGFFIAAIPLVICIIYLIIFFTKLFL